MPATSDCLPARIYDYTSNKQILCDVNAYCKICLIHYANREANYYRQLASQDAIVA